MNEKELNKLVKEHYGFTIEELDNDVAYWCFRCSELQQENQQLHNKIDKAIEYLEDDDNFWILDSYSEDKVKMIQEELKQILKDSDVDE